MVQQALRELGGILGHKTGKHVFQNRTERRIGLARVLSKLGYCSRSAARNLIEAGHVRVNGRVVWDPEAPCSERARIEVGGKKIGESEKVYLMLNKPRGLVTTARDEKGRDTVYSLLPEYRQWLAPVGRLDKASEGLLLLTNDSEWAARITSPETQLDKTYHVQIAALAGQELLGRLIAGTQADGDFLAAKRAAVLRAGKKTCWLEVVLDGGKNRHIRRMLSALGMEVLRLVRISIGPLSLGELAKGSCRQLTQEEVGLLDREIGWRRKSRS